MLIKRISYILITLKVIFWLSVLTCFQCMMFFQLNVNCFPKPCHSNIFYQFSFFKILNSVDKVTKCELEIYEMSNLSFRHCYPLFVVCPSIRGSDSSPSFTSFLLSTRGQIHLTLLCPFFKFNLNLFWL